MAKEKIEGEQSQFVLLTSIDGRMVADKSRNQRDTLVVLSRNGAEQLHVIAIWSQHARRGDIMLDGNTAILCTSGRRQLDAGPINCVRALLDDIEKRQHRK